MRRQLVQYQSIPALERNAQHHLIVEQSHGNYAVAIGRTMGEQSISMAARDDLQGAGGDRRVPKREPHRDHVGLIGVFRNDASVLMPRRSDELKVTSHAFGESAL